MTRQIGYSVPGSHTWTDVLAVTDKFKDWSEEWGNIELLVGA